MLNRFQLQMLFDLVRTHVVAIAYYTLVLIRNKEAVVEISTENLPVSVFLGNVCNELFVHFTYLASRYFLRLFLLQ